MKSFLLCLLLGSLLGCAAENESMGKLSKDRQNLAAKISDSEAQNVLIFNEGSAIVEKSEGSLNLRISSFEPIQAIYVDNIPMTLAGRSFDFFIQIPYELKSDREIFTVEVYTTENVIKQEILLKHKPS
tara:strand:+ start:785 stop:1171 length:387 start_codon:yes stop_codon:yes gene_type:complete